jgi:hypothetical protein
MSARGRAPKAGRRRRRQNGRPRGASAPSHGGAWGGSAARDTLGPSEWCDAPAPEAGAAGRLAALTGQVRERFGRPRGGYSSWASRMASATSRIDLRVFMDSFWILRKASASLRP